MLPHAPPLPLPHLFRQYRERIIFIGNNINEEMGNQLVGTMLFLDTVSNKDLYLYVNTKGGDIVPAFAIHDTMKAR